MSYLVLARKWRPQSFDEVIGQNHVTRTLQNALKNGRVAHALIFSGPRGVGKTSIARILAKALNCKHGPKPTPCNSCEICKQITAGFCVDVNEIDGASNRGIDEIRQLKEEIRFQPVIARYRVYIIDEVHMLTNEAFNALLKTLEEPPSHAYFIFATTEPRKIPETIHSRCQHFEFRPLTEADLAAHLIKISKNEGLDLPLEAIQVVARQAKGSVRDSLSLLDQVIAYGATNYEEVCDVLGVAGPSALEELSKAILSGNPQETMLLLNKLYSKGVDLQGLAQDLLKFLRDLSIIKQLDLKSSIELTKLDEKRILTLKDSFSAFSYLELLNALEKLSASMDELYRSQDPKITLEIVLLQLCAQPSLSEIDELIAKIDELIESHGLEDKNQITKEAKIQNKEEPKDNKQLIQDEAFINRWYEFVIYVKKQKPQLASMLDACKDLKFNKDKGCLLVKCTSDFKGQMLCDREKAREISFLANSFFNKKIDIKFELDKSLDDNNGNSKKQLKKLNPRDELIQNPLVQEVINVFQARVSSVNLYTKLKKNGKGSLKA